MALVKAMVLITMCVVMQGCAHTSWSEACNNFEEWKYKSEEACWRAAHYHTQLELAQRQMANQSFSQGVSGLINALKPTQRQGTPLMQRHMVSPIPATLSVPKMPEPNNGGYPTY